jgi:hypothetical protein
MIRILEKTRIILKKLKFQSFTDKNTSSKTKIKKELRGILKSISGSFTN